jgi:hypothetical protein
LHRHQLLLQTLQPQLLVTCREYSQCLTSHWSHAENILSAWHLIGHMQRIFSAPDILLVTCREYSQCLTSYWSHAENILSAWHLNGHMQRILSASDSLLDTCREYSQCLIAYWSHVENILSAWQPSQWSHSAHPCGDNPPSIIRHHYYHSNWFMHTHYAGV